LSAFPRCSSEFPSASEQPCFVLRATDAYQKECAKWEEAYGEKATPKAETMHDKIQRYKEKVDRQNASQPYRSRDKGAR